MTRGRKLGVLLLALAALLVLTIVVMELAPDGEGTEEATAVTIFTLDPDQVTSLTWQYEEETISPGEGPGEQLDLSGGRGVSPGPVLSGCDGAGPEGDSGGQDH